VQQGKTKQPLIWVIKVIVETEIRDYRHYVATFCDTTQARHSRNANARATPSEHQVHNQLGADSGPDGSRARIRKKQLINGTSSFVFFQDATNYNCVVD